MSTRRLFAVLLAFLVLVLAACGQGGAESDTTAAGDETEAAESTGTPAGSPAADAEPSGAATAGAATGEVTIDDVEPLEEEATLRLAVSGNQILALPLFLALDKGWFAQAGLDVQPDVYRGSSNEQIPRMAIGEIDVSLATPSPALFNQISEDFGIQLVASLGEEMDGRITSAWLMVLPGLEDELVEPADLEGRRVEGAREGSPPALLVDQALEKAGLTEEDVQLTYRVQSPPDMLALAEAQAADVVAMNEPLATQAEQAGVAVRWLGVPDVMPWFQPGLLAASPTYLEQNPEAVEKFLEVYLVASRYVNSFEGEWDPELLEVVESNLETSPEQITAQGGVPFFSPTGEILTDSLERSQQIFIEDGLLENEIDVTDLVAEDPLAGAVAGLEGGGDR